MTTYMIPFTQYIAPRGNSIQTDFMAPENTYLKAIELLDRGYVFECEVLRTGEVSLTISDGAEDVAIEIAENMNSIDTHIEKLIRDFYTRIK